MTVLKNMALSCHGHTITTRQGSVTCGAMPMPTFCTVIDNLLCSCCYYYFLPVLLVVVPVVDQSLSSTLNQEDSLQGHLVQASMLVDHL